MGFAAAGMLFTGISTGLQVYSQIQQGKTAETIAKYNNDLALSEAHNQELQFAEAAKRETLNQRKDMATLRAQLSTQGTSITTGTPLSIMGETAGLFQTRLADAARASAMQAESIRQKGRMGIWEAGQQKQASTLAAIGTTIQGVSSAVSAYSHNRYTGAF